MLNLIVNQKNSGWINVNYLRKKAENHILNGYCVSLFSAAVIVLSDTVAAGRKPDTAGKSVVETLTEAGFDPIHYQILPDEADDLKELVLEFSKSYACIMTVGGTGIGKRDITVDTLEPLLERKLDGLMEAARSFGQKRTPYAAMSRGVAGFIDRSLVVTLPGSRGQANQWPLFYPH
jgi:molybdenum cofactor synthesis domain-containing protein